MKLWNAHLVGLENTCLQHHQSHTFCFRGFLWRNRFPNPWIDFLRRMWKSVINASSSSVLFECNKHIVSQYFSILFIFRIKEKSWKSKRFCLAFHVWADIDIIGIAVVYSWLTREGIRQSCMVAQPIIIVLKVKIGFLPYKAECIHGRIEPVFTLFGSPTYRRREWISCCQNVGKRAGSPMQPSWLSHAKFTVSIICSLICLLEIHWFILENLARLLYHAVAQMGADLSSGKSRKMQFSAVCLSTTSTSPFWHFSENSRKKSLSSNLETFSSRPCRDSSFRISRM